MHDDFQVGDPRVTWQQQPVGAVTMSLILLQQRARQLHAKTRRQSLTRLAGPAGIALLYAVAAGNLPHFSSLLHWLFALILVWSLLGVYSLRQAGSSRPMASDAGFSAGVQFCRDEVRRQRAFLRKSLWWIFVPMFLGVVTLQLGFVNVLGAARLSTVTPLIVVGIVWVLTCLFIWFRQDRILKREFEELNELSNNKAG